MSLSRSRIHVVAAAVVNDRDEVLISLRPKHVHQGGLWEFPGGKLEANEGVVAGLQRELKEELGIHIDEARQLIRVHHDYPDKSVLLDVWLVKQFSGEPHGREGQQWRWVQRESLRDYAFPAANHPIINALQLPSVYLITPESRYVRDDFLSQLEYCLGQGVRLVQFRAKEVDETEYLSLACEVLVMCQRHGARLLLNVDHEKFIEHIVEIGAHGAHLTSACLRQTTKRPLPENMLLAASCHSLDELKNAQDIGADFAVLSPVKATVSHPNSKPLGWQQFQSLVDEIAIPVYALGGMSLEDSARAYEYGGQGIAAIRSLWNHPNE
jgi:8-oxo-dGTP diphosphatase